MVVLYKVTHEVTLKPIMNVDPRNLYGSTWYPLTEKDTHLIVIHPVSLSDYSEPVTHTNN